MERDGLLLCDPEDPLVGNPVDTVNGVREPVDVYTTPVIIKSQVNSEHKVAVWTERNLIHTVGETEGYYFVKVKADEDPPTCIIHTDDTLHVNGVVSPTDASDFDGSSSSPVLLNGLDSTLLFPTLQGYVNRYEIESNGWPADPAGGATHYSDQVVSTTFDMGTDTSAFVDPDQNLMLFGTRCAAGVNCEQAMDFGQLYLVDLSDPTSASSLDTSAIQAWTFGAPVGLSDIAGAPPNDILIALGTYESASATAPFTGYDAQYPGTFKSVALWGANEYEIVDTDSDGVYDDLDFLRSVVIELDLVAASVCTSCTFNIALTSSIADLVGTFDDSGSDKPIIWGPGAAGHWYNSADPTEEYLVYVIATAARTHTNPHTDEYCVTASGDIPPRLNVFYREDVVGSTWQHDWVDLVADAANPKCYEEDEAAPGAYVPIEVPGGVTISGDSIFVATNDGRFWVYNTTEGLEAEGSSNQYLLSGLAPGWPRYRKNNLGTARNY